MEQKTLQLALDFSQEGEAHTGGVRGAQSCAVLSEMRTLVQSLIEAVVEPRNMLIALKRSKEIRAAVVLME